MANQTFEKLKAQICAGTATASQISSACLPESEKQALLIELADCQPGGAVVTTPVNVVRCGGLVEAVTAGQTIIAGTTAPIPVCIVNDKPKVDFEIGCASNDGRLVVRVFAVSEAGVVTSTLFEQDGVTPAPVGVTMVKCDSSSVDWELVQTCFEDVSGVEYTRVIFLDPAGVAASPAAVWLNSLGAVITAPAGVTPCAVAAPLPELDLVVTTESGCAAGVPWTRRTSSTVNNATGLVTTTVTEFVNSAGVVQTAAPAGFTLGACPAPAVLPELDLVVTTEPGCAAGVPWTRRTSSTVDNVSGLALSSVTEFVDSAGVVQLAAPAGFTLGACPVAAPAPEIHLVITTEPGCAAGVPWTRRTTKTVDTVLGVVMATVQEFVDSTGGVQAVAPVGFTLGACPVVTPVPAPLTFKPGGVSIADGTFAGTLGPDGTSWNMPANVTSVTVKARRSNNTDATAAALNTVRVGTSNGDFYLLADESITFSVEDLNLLTSLRVAAVGNAAALIIFNTL